jgi:hypothetical protein
MFFKNRRDRYKREADKLATDLGTFGKYYAAMAKTSEGAAKFIKKHPKTVAAISWVAGKTVGYKHPDVSKSVDAVMRGESVDDVVDKLLDSGE